jgi:hypothetical protein
MRCGFSGNSPVRLRNDVAQLGYEVSIMFYHAIVELHKHGKESIPLLIDEINNREKSIGLIFSHPHNSHFGEIYDCYGFLYVYLVELILGREKIKESADSYGGFLGPRENYVFWYGLLAKENGKTTSCQDLKEIQGVYRAWWEKNREKSLPELRRAWKNKSGPLSGSGFFWN